MAPPNDFPARWSKQGIELLPSQEIVLESLLSRPPIVRPTLVRWGEVHWLSAARPWPSVHLRWSGKEHTFGPSRGTGISTRQHERFAAHVEILFADAAQHLEHERIDRGWLDDPDLAWERAKKLPELEAPRRVVGHGAFRSSMPPEEEHAIAIRRGPTAFEAMLQWLASRPERWWRDHPREIRLTSHHVYVERRDRTLWRIAMVVTERRGDLDAVFVFGRRAELVLPHREGCPVRAVLDAKLGTQEPVEPPKEPPRSSPPPKPRGRRQ